MYFCALSVCPCLHSVSGKQTGSKSLRGTCALRLSLCVAKLLKQTFEMLTLFTRKLFCNFTLCTLMILSAHSLPTLAQPISIHLKAHNAKVVYMMQRFQSWAFVLVNIGPISDLSRLLLPKNFLRENRKSGASTPWSLSALGGGLAAREGRAANTQEESPV